MVRERLANDVVSVFILPPSAETLCERLAARSTEDDVALAARLEHAVEEVGEAEDYDYVVVNDDRDRAVARVESIIDVEASRTTRHRNLEHTIRDLRDAIVRQLRIMKDQER